MKEVSWTIARVASIRLLISLQVKQRLTMIKGPTAPNATLEVERDTVSASGREAAAVSELPT